MRTRELVLQVIETEWPVSVSIAAKELRKLNGHRCSIQMVKYHFDSLEKSGTIRTKKIGRNLVAWPIDIEKLRMIHELLR